jgi:hypothetical protein
VWLASTFAWRNVVASPDQYTAVIYIAARGGNDH